MLYKIYRCTCLLVILSAFSAVHSLKGQLNADFSASLTRGCTPQLIRFSDQSSGTITSWNWDFGNGATSALQHPSTIYNLPGTYQVTLTVSGPLGTDTEVKNAYITIFPSPVVDFSVNLTEACQKEAFAFTSLATPASGGAPLVSYFWDFGDGNSAITTSVSHAYAVAGTRSVSLRVVDGNGCEAFLQKTNVLKVNPVPQPAFIADKTSSCLVPLAVQFTNQTAGSGLQFFWDLGNGTSTLTSPSTAYAASGAYSVGLIAVDPLTGCRDTLRKPGYIQVGNFPIDFTPDPLRGCKDQAVNFPLSGSTPQNVLWDFGDGTFSNALPGSHVYGSAGTYQVTLTATFPGGCRDSIKKSIQIDNATVPAFAINPDKSCVVPFNVSFVNNNPGNSSFWEFGDGDTSSQRNTLHTYSGYGPYIITFTTITPGGCRSSLNDTIDFKPEIRVLPNPRQTCGTSANVSFNYSTNPLGPTAFSWDFDDGNTSALARPTHAYTQEGQYIVKLTVTYANGCKATGQDTVSIFSPPVPGFEANLRDTCVKKTIRFTNKSTNFTAFEWDFGDGGKDSINVNPTHNYRSWPKILQLPDSFDIKLTLWNGTCKKDTTITNYINIDPPLAWIETDNPEGLYCDTPAVVRFRDVSRYVNPRDTVYRVWYFNDPYAHRVNFQQCTTDTKNNINVGLNCNYSLDSLPTHRYSRFGDYNTQLWLFSHRTRCQDSINFMVRVRPRFQTTIKADTVSGCAPLFVRMSDESSRSVRWFWDFGDSRIDSDTDVVKQTAYTYVLPGKYQPTLYAWDADGCQATASKLVDVRGPRASFKTAGRWCPPDTVSFFDISQNTDSLVSWRWDFGDGAQTDTSILRHPRFRFSASGTYLVNLTVVDQLGCRNSITRMLEYAPPKPVFQVVPEIVCVPGTVQFQNYTAGGFANRYHWRFGDGDTSNLLNPAHTYQDTGSYPVFLRVTRADGCSDSVSIPDRVKIVDPVFDFSANKTKGLCPPFTVVFRLTQSPDIEEYCWDFGDSSNSTIKDPVHTYEKPGLYTVSLRVKSRGGCYDSIVKVDYIEVGGPRGTFTFGPARGCNPLPVHFQASAANVAVYTWDYGDGTIEYLTSDTAYHVYRKNGFFRPQLIMTDSNNCSQTFSSPDTVYTDSRARADFAPDAPELCVGGTVRFTDRSQPAAAIVQRQWAINGNIEGTGTGFQRQFNDTGTFTVSLRITDDIGCESDTQLSIRVKSFPLVAISSDTAICFGADAELWVSGGVSYRWSPGPLRGPDTTQRIQVSPLTTTLYRVDVTSGPGCPNQQAQVRVTVWPLPPVDLGTRKTLCMGDSVELAATGAQTYAWQPSSYLSDTTRERIWVKPDQPVYFKVFGTDANGCRNYDSVLVEPIQAPEPQIAGPDKVCYGARVTLSATGGDQFLWSTGETTPSIQARLYQDEVFWIQSSLRGCFGGADTARVEVDKSVFGADFELNRDTFFTGEKLELTNTSFGAIAYAWYPGTGVGPVFDSVPEFTYRNEGEYWIRLIARSETGCLDTAEKRVIISPDFFYFPNAFTPNGDLNNQLYRYFFPYDLAKAELLIYDRWGERIFYSDNQYRLWDGTYRGAPVPEGVYLYIFYGQKHSGERVQQRGTITLLR